MSRANNCWSDEYRLLRKDGTAAYVLDRGYVIYDLGGRAVRMIGAIMDITRRRQVEAALRLRERAMEASVNPIVVVDQATPDAPIVYVNEAFQRVTGYSREEALGRNCRFLQGDDQEQPELDKIRWAIRDQRDGHAVLRNYRKDGSLFWNDLYIAPVRDPSSGLVTHFVGMQYDITEIKRYQAELERQANFDALTGLPNRNLLHDRLKQTLLFAERNGQSVTVVFLDLDHFKRINDSLGHDAGDRLLKLVGERLASSIREGDTVARLGGDEFVLVLPGQAIKDTNHNIMDRLLGDLSQTFILGGREINVSCSAGLSVYPEDGTEPEVLLRNADAAMYRAKAGGSSDVQFYSREMNANIEEELALEMGMRRALERGEFFVEYQPQIELATERIIGLEALIRWQHPERGRVAPGSFIALAEDTGLIVPIGEWVLRTACAQNKAFQDAGLATITVAVNLSPRQFRQKELAKLVASILDSCGLDPQYLELEVTEGMVMHNVEGVIRTLNELKEVGVHLSVDDFGTGYSSLNYLKRFPVDRLKIDQSFCRDVVSDPDDAAIAKAVVGLGHGIGLKVIAEGVENELQLAFFKAIGCDEAQGYYFSRPQLPQDIRSLLFSDWISRR